MWSPLLTISDHYHPADLWPIRHRITVHQRPRQWCEDRVAWRWWRRRRRGNRDHLTC